MDRSVTKICLLIRTLYSGGAEKQTLLLAKALKDHHEVYVVVQKGDNADNLHIGFLNKYGISFLLLKGNTFRRMLIFRSFLKKKGINIIFSFLTSDNLWSALIGRTAGVPVRIGGIRNEALPYYKFWLNKILQRFFLQGVVFNNYRGYEKFIKKGFDKKKSFVIHNCLFSLPPPRKWNAGKKVRIVTVARFVKGKDYHTAIKTIHFLKNQLLVGGQEIEYNIIGYGELTEQIKKWIGEYGLSDSISLVIKPVDLDQFYLNSDIYLSTSVMEGLSNSVMEAMSFSLPVVTTDAGDNGLLVENGINGFVCPLYSYRQLARALHKLIVRPELRMKFGELGYRRIKEDFSLDNLKGKYLELIDSFHETFEAVYN